MKHTDNKETNSVARNPLIPRTPGEQAVDRLLNQTLPQILQNQQRKQEREDD